MKYFINKKFEFDFEFFARESRSSLVRDAEYKLLANQIYPDYIVKHDNVYRKKLR